MSDVPPGYYAIIAFYDFDGNGLFDYYGGQIPFGIYPEGVFGALASFLFDMSVEIELWGYRAEM